MTLWPSIAWLPRATENTVMEYSATFNVHTSTMVTRMDKYILRYHKCHNSKRTCFEEASRCLTKLAQLSWEFPLGYISEEATLKANEILPLSKF